MMTDNNIFEVATSENIYNQEVTNLNFRLRLDIGGANIRIEDKILKGDNGIFYVDTKSGLDMDFDIVKSCLSEANKSTITIWNLSHDTYNKIYQEASAFELYGAWSSDEYALMFRGYPDMQKKVAKETLITANEGFMKQDYRAGFRGQNDLPTVLTLLDGKTSYQDATINKYYKGEISSELVFNDLIESMGLIKHSIPKDIEFKVIKNFSAYGKSATVMNYIAKLNSFKWTIMNGIFEAYTGEKPAQPYGIILDGLNCTTPEKQNDKFKTRTQVLQKKNKKKGLAGIKRTYIEKTDMGYMLETQLLPFLNPGLTARCDFDILKGDKFIYKVEHIGNNYGTNCVTRLWVV